MGRHARVQKWWLSWHHPWNELRLWWKRVNFSMGNRKICTRNILLFGGENSCRFNDIIGSSFVPRDSARIIFTEDFNGFALDKKFFILRFDMAIKATMNRIKLEQISLKKLKSSLKIKTLKILILTIYSTLMNGLHKKVSERRYRQKWKRQYSLIATTSRWSISRAFRSTIRPIRPYRSVKAVHIFDWKKGLSHQNCRKAEIDQPNSIEGKERREPVDTDFNVLKKKD